MGRSRGLTLLEILIALIVMVIGLVGILALFPPAMASAKASMEDTTAGFVAESVANALAASSRRAQRLPDGRVRLVLTHDSESSVDGALVYYTFDLPAPADGWAHHPGGAASAAAPEREPEWRLSGDPWTRLQLAAVRSNDPSDPLGQFAYSFDVRAAEPGLWEVRLHVMRVHVVGASFGAGTAAPGPGVTAKRLVATLSTRVTVP